MQHRIKDKLTVLRQSVSKVAENVSFALTTMWSLDKKLFIQTCVIYGFQGLAPILIAFLSGQLIDAVLVAATDGAGLAASIYILVALTATQLLFSHSFNMQYYISLRLRKDFSLYLAEGVFSKFHELDHSHYEDPAFSKQANKIHENINVIAFVPERTLELLTRVLQLVVTALTIIVVSPVVVVLLLVSIMPLVITLMRTAKERWRIWDRIDHDLRFRASLDNTLSDVGQVNEVKIFNLSGYFQGLWRKYYSRTENRRIEVERSAQKKLFAASVAESIVQFGVMIWLLLRVVREAGFSLGDFEFYRRLVMDFSNASGQMAAGFQSLSESNLFLRDYKDFMSRTPRVVNNPRVKIHDSSIPEIEFNNVSFKYPGSSEYVLKNLNMKISAGDDIALVGANGAGKTTIIKLLMRFYDVSEGQILIDGTDIREIDLVQWYRQIGVLFQHFNKYSYLKARRSIGVGDISNIDNVKEVEAASHKAGADNYIDELPNKYETILSKVYTGGTDLSGGEWQRIALARAFFRNANILILDEPTSSVDAKAEYEIFKNINETQKEKTTIIISHRFSTVRNADTIYVVEDGTIKESGSHEELIKMKGTYSELFERQAEGYR